MKKIKNILILAGGDSARFWPLTKKSYFPFLGHPLLSQQLNILKRFAKKIFVVANSSDIHLIKELQSKNEFEISLQKDDLKGQAGAILSAKNKIKGEVLILNAEDIINPELLYRYIDITISNSVEFLFAVKKVKKYFPGAYLKFKNNKVEKIVEKPDPMKIPSNLVKLVVDYFKDFDKFIEILETAKSDKDDVYETAINNFLTQNIRVKHIEYDDYWYSLKYPWQVLSLINFFLNSQGKDKIRIGINVKIAKTAKIVGPCFIDDNTVVGDFVMIRQSHIGKNCLIGGYSEITRSYLGEGVSLHRNFIGDSVLVDRVSFGAQAATANFRFDEKSIKSLVKGKKIDTNLIKFGTIVGSGSKIGSNATLLPGVKIGRNTFIGPGEIISQDVEDNKFIMGTKKLKNKISDNLLEIRENRIP